MSKRRSSRTSGTVAYDDNDTFHFHVSSDKLSKIPTQPINSRPTTKTSNIPTNTSDSNKSTATNTRTARSSFKQADVQMKEEIPATSSTAFSHKYEFSANSNSKSIESKESKAATSSSDSIRSRNQQRFAARRRQLQKEQEEERKVQAEAKQQEVSESSSSSSSDCENEEKVPESRAPRGKNAANNGKTNSNKRPNRKSNISAQNSSKFDPSTIDLDQKDDYCAVCGHAGNLIVCAFCVQAYHLICLNLSDPTITPETLPDDWNCANIPHKTCTTRPKPRKQTDFLSEEEKKQFKWLGAPQTRSKNKFYTKFERCEEIYSVGDHVMLGAPESLLIAAQLAEILACWEDQYGAKWLEIRWYYLPEETRWGRRPENDAHECFASAHVKEVELATVQCKISILSEANFREKEAAGATDEYCYYCSKRYNHDSGEFRPIIANSDDFLQDNSKKSGRKGTTQRNSASFNANLPQVSSNSMDSSLKRRLTGAGGLSIYEKASSALQLSAVPSVLPCREAEKQQISTFLSNSISRGGDSGGLYIAGVPGTGKTATVRQVIRELKGISERGELAAFDFIEINGMKLPDPLQLYSALWYSLKNKHVAAAKAVDLLDSYFKTASSRRNCLILLVDELDSVINKRQNVIYNLFDWPTRKSSRLIVIGISNTMDLPELLAPRVNSRLGLTRIPFKPYNKQQILAILANRLGEIGSILDPDSAQLCAMKVASVSGDIRRALQICRRAVEIAQLENKLLARKKAKNKAKNIEEDGKNGEIEPEEAKVLVSMSHIERACADLVNSNSADFLARCSTYEKLVLYSLLAEFRAVNGQEAEFVAVAERCERVAAGKGLQPVPSHWELEQIVLRLVDINILRLSKQANQRYGAISLCGLLPDDVSDALAHDSTFSQ
jgi:origin recognition complex subunit 1